MCGGLQWSVTGLAPMDFVALYYDMVPFNLVALLHARTRTDVLDQGLVGKLSLRRTFWTELSPFYGPWTICERGTLGGRERRGEKGEVMRVKKIVCKKNRLID